LPASETPVELIQENENSTTQKKEVKFSEEEKEDDLDGSFDLKNTREKIYCYEGDDVVEKEIKKSYTMTANEIQNLVDDPEEDLHQVIGNREIDDLVDEPQNEGDQQLESHNFDNQNESEEVK
jgi:hypothetical protein